MVDASYFLKSPQQCLSVAWLFLDLIFGWTLLPHALEHLVAFFDLPVQLHFQNLVETDALFLQLEDVLLVLLSLLLTS